jgi:hypothetical protein
LTEREERSASRSPPTSRSPAGPKAFTDPRLWAAIVDRLTVAGQIIETGTTVDGSPTPGPAAPPADQGDQPRTDRIDTVPR